MTDKPQQPIENQVGDFFKNMLAWGIMADVGGSLGANPAMPTAAPGMGAGLLNMLGGAKSIFGAFLGLDAMADGVHTYATIVDQPKNNPQLNRAPTPGAPS